MKTKWLRVGIGIFLLLPFSGPPLFAGWVPEGTVVCSEQENQHAPVICSAGAKRSIIAWYDMRNGNFDIYAQMMRNNGSLLWPAGGIPICTETGHQQTVRIIPDGTGGAIITWQDRRSGNWDIYARRLYLEEPIEAVLDIRPGSCTNPFNPKSRGLLPAAVLGTENLDVSDIDHGSILLEGIAPVRWSYRDVATPPTGENDHGCAPANSDGFTDLVLMFETEELAATRGELSKGGKINMTLTGRLEDGTDLTAGDFVIVRGNQDNPDKDTSGRITFTSNTTDRIQIINFELPGNSMLEINVYDVAGRLVKRLRRSVASAGTHSVEWNTTGFGSGVYFIQVKTDRQRMTRKIVLIR